MIKNIIIATLCLLTLSMTGCIQRLDMNTTITKQSRIEHLQKMQNWHAEGRVAIQSTTQSQTASFKWQQHGQEYKVYLYSPFSTESVTIAGNATSKRVLTATGVSDSSIELDENLPFAQLGYWVKGLPTPNSSTTMIKYDAYNQIQTLNQDGWQIDYQKYQSCTPVSLPEKILLTNGETKVKVFIKQSR